MKTIPLTQGKIALVDDQDFALVSQFKWYAHYDGYNWYAQTSIGDKQIQMHRLLLGLTNSHQKTDHRDHDGCNNQRWNLRVCSHAQNTRNKRFSRTNTSGFKGVSWSKRIKRWVAVIARQHLGCFSTAREAALAYDAAATEKFGEFALTNRDLGLLCYAGKPIAPEKNARLKFSRFKGVSRSRNHWMASTVVAGKFHYFGVHDSETAARQAYEAGVKNLHAE